VAVLVKEMMFRFVETSDSTNVDRQARGRQYERRICNGLIFETGGNR
jgi:hypothetical protein